MSLFKKSGGEDGPPEWAGFFTKEEYEKINSEIRNNKKDIQDARQEIDKNKKEIERVVLE